MSEPDTAQSGAWQPAFPGQRPPFAPGNQVSVGNWGPLQHGAFSPRRVDPVAADLVTELLRQPDTAYLAAESYRPAVWAWARAEAQCRLLDDWLVGCGLDVSEAESLSVRAQLDRAERRAERARAALGLTPLARARLGRDITAARLDLAQVLADERARQERGTPGGAAVAVEGGPAPGSEGDETGVER